MIKKDKLMHFGACMMVSLTGWYGVSFAAGAAIAKEYDDSREHGNIWSWGDILADVAGIGFGISIHLLVF